MKKSCKTFRRKARKATAAVRGALKAVESFRKAVEKLPAVD